MGTLEYMNFVQEISIICGCKKGKVIAITLDGHIYLLVGFLRVQLYLPQVAIILQGRLEQCE